MVLHTANTTYQGYIGVVSSNITIASFQSLTLQADTDVELYPGIGKDVVVIGGACFRSSSSGRDLGSLSYPWGKLWVNKINKVVQDAALTNTMHTILPYSVASYFGSEGSRWGRVYGVPILDRVGASVEGAFKHRDFGDAWLSTYSNGGWQDNA
ncbi:hypothetical protein ES708_23797 [subsurface metagenome]